MASDGLESKLSDAKFGRLKRIAKAMHNFYYPDFRTDIHNIAGYVGLYVDSIGGKKQEYVQKSLDLLKKIRDFYEEKAKKYRLDSWMFEELRNTRDLLPKLDNTLNLLFDKRGIGEKETETMLTGYINEILKGTTDYGVMLKELGQEIRNNPLTIYFRINLPNNRGFLRGVKRDAFNN